MAKKTKVLVKEIKHKSPTAYDDAFRTMTVDCIRLLIPVINEVFDKHYTGDERIELHQNEHFINQQDGDEQKRITDSAFTIFGEEEETYLFECQSVADGSMLVRIFEYVTQIALDRGEFTVNRLIVNIPNAAVLYLRSDKNTPDAMEVEINAAGGKLIIPVRTIQIQKYSLDEIFEKGLYFLLPFFIFTHEKEFKEYDADPKALNALKDEYVKLMELLNEATRNKKISAYERRTIIDMSKKVLENIARKYENVKEGVETIMGGHVLEHEGKTIHNEGVSEGRMQEKQDTAVRLYEMGNEIDTIAAAVSASPDQVRKWVKTPMTALAF